MTKAAINMIGDKKAKMRKTKRANINNPTIKITITATPMMAFHGLSLLLLWLMVQNFQAIYNK